MDTIPSLGPVIAVKWILRLIVGGWRLRADVRNPIKTGVFFFFLGGSGAFFLFFFLIVGLF